MAQKDEEEKQHKRRVDQNLIKKIFLRNEKMRHLCLCVLELRLTHAHTQTLVHTHILSSLLFLCHFRMSVI